MKWLTKLDVIFDRALDASAIIAGVILSLTTLGVNVAIVSRYFLKSPQGWITELASYSLLWMTLLVAAWVLRGEGHVIVDIVLVQLKPRPRAAMNVVTSAMCFVVSLILAWFGAVVAWDLFQTGYFTPTVLALPKAPIIAIIFVGFFLLAIQFLRRINGNMKNWRAPRVKEEAPKAIESFEA